MGSLCLNVFFFGSLFRIVDMLWDWDWGFGWEDMAVIAKGLGFGTSALCAMGRVDQKRTIDLQALCLVFRG